MVVSNILDPVHDTLDPTTWDAPTEHFPVLKPQHKDWILSKVNEVLKSHGYSDMEQWLEVYLTGSLTTFQYSDDSDCDISLFVNTDVFPEWSRAEMIGIMVGNFDGTILPGTTHPMQGYVVAKGIRPQDLYKPGLRSGYEVAQDKWVVPPERDRSHDVANEQNGDYQWALEQADKMERLLRYEPDKAVKFWHQIHSRRMADQKMGKGDYSQSNIIYKFLANRGLMPQIAGVSGEYIARHESLHDNSDRVDRISQLQPEVPVGRENLNQWQTAWSQDRDDGTQGTQGTDHRHSVRNSRHALVSESLPDPSSVLSERQSSLADSSDTNAGYTQPSSDSLGALPSGIDDSNSDDHRESLWSWQNHQELSRPYNGNKSSYQLGEDSEKLNGFPDISEASGEYIAKTALFGIGEKNYQRNTLDNPHSSDYYNNVHNERIRLWNTAYRLGVSPYRMTLRHEPGEWGWRPHGYDQYLTEGLANALHPHSGRKHVPQSQRQWTPELESQWQQQLQQQKLHQYQTNPNASAQDYQDWLDWYAQHASEHFDPASQTQEIEPQEPKAWYESKTANLMPHPDQVELAKQRLNLQHPVRFMPTYRDIRGGYAGMSRDPQTGMDSHLIFFNPDQQHGPKNWAAWHELAHAAQHERGDGNGPTTGLPDAEYAALPSEQEAEAIAEQHAELDLWHKTAHEELPRVLYNKFAPQVPHPPTTLDKSSTSLPFIYDPKDNIVHMGPPNALHWELIRRTPELRVQYPEDKAYKEFSALSVPNHLHGRLEWPAKHTDFMGLTSDNDYRNEVNAALGATAKPDQEWRDAFSSTNEGLHVGQAEENVIIGQPSSEEVWSFR